MHICSRDSEIQKKEMGAAGTHFVTTRLNPTWKVYQLIDDRGDATTVRYGDARRHSTKNL